MPARLGLIAGQKFIDKADFSFTKFLGPTDFDSAAFESSVSFDEAEFGKDSKVSFFGSCFQDEVSFQKAIFSGYLNFEGAGSRDVFGDNSSLSLRKARLEAPEKLSFHSVTLRPNWFVDADTRKFGFANVKWESAKGREISAKDELSSLENGSNATHCPTLARYRLLSIACRQLAENSETNNRFEEASKFRQVAMDTEWREKKAKFRTLMGHLFTKTNKLKRRFAHYVFGIPAKAEDLPKAPAGPLAVLRRSDDIIIHWLYRITSYYGESWAWALGILLLITLIFFPMIYMQTSFQLCPRERPLAMSIAICESKDQEVKKGCECRKDGLGFGEAVVHSLTTATLQSVDYRKPTTLKGETVVILEKIFAPLQVALLALALRRKFMR